MPLPQDDSRTLPIWRGRRGLVATVLLALLALASGLGLAAVAERAGVVPACRTYAQAQGWQYLSYRTYASTTRSGAICTFKSDAGHTEEILLRDISWLTSVWVSFALSLVITVPALLLLFAVVRTWLHQRFASGRAQRN